MQGVLRVLEFHSDPRPLGSLAPVVIIIFAHLCLKIVLCNLQVEVAICTYFSDIRIEIRNNDSSAFPLTTLSVVASAKAD